MACGHLLEKKSMLVRKHKIKRGKYEEKQENRNKKWKNEK
jgi:hypothetical protein